jgi:xylan 1,4-beta-xylosidase
MGMRIWACLLAALGICAGSAGRAEQLEVISIDPAAPAHPLPHFWERFFGSGRALLSLRESYRQDLRAVRAVTSMQYVRFHAILHDEVGVYQEDAQGEARYNFSYVDQIYDGLLANGVRPFVELSFMPRQLASREVHNNFFYAPNVSPPKDYERWDALMQALGRHLVERYGIDEVSHWYFEVWNEPNLEFWAGEPRQRTYFELYDHTARALKAVDAGLRVGGPSTAQAAWVGDFIRHCVTENVPLDFVTTHVYGNDDAKNVFASPEPVAREQFVCRAVGKVHAEIKASPRPELPLIWSEFNASWFNEPQVTDTSYMGPWLAETVRQCDGLVDNMSYWTFSDVFEEGGVVRTPFYGGFGLIAAGGVPKPAFNAFALLHGLGDTRLEVAAPQSLLTRRPDGTLVLALWNYAPPGTRAPARVVRLRLGATGARSISLRALDAEHGDPLPTYRRMGEPRYPTAAQLTELREAARLPPPHRRAVTAGAVRLEIPAHGLLVVTIPAPARH